MNKKLISAVLFGILILTGVCVNASDTGIKKEAGFISLNASKTKEIEPNIARVTFAVENTAETAQKADKALYEAKETGRNRVIIA